MKKFLAFESFGTRGYFIMSKNFKLHCNSTLLILKNHSLPHSCCSASATFQIRLFSVQINVEAKPQIGKGSVYGRMSAREEQNWVMQSALQLQHAGCIPANVHLSMPFSSSLNQ